MLKLFRNRGIFVKIILWMIVIGVGGMLALSLIPGLGSSQYLRDPAGFLAQIGDRVVTPFEANRSVTRQLQQFGAIDNQAFRRVLLERSIEDLITLQAIQYEARRLGFRSPIEEIVQQLQTNPVFYPDGKFVGTAVYENIIRQQTGMSAIEYERQSRDQLVLQKLYLWVTGGVQPTVPEIEQEFRRRNEKVKLEYVVFRAQDFRDRLGRPTEAELRPYYDANRESFPLPERRAVRYVEINQAILGSRAQVSEDQIERLYRERRADYLELEAVRLRHILFAATGEEQKESNRTVAEQVLEDLRGGADFTRLAADYSTDPNTSSAGGELGWVERGQMPELDARLFSVTPGSPPELVEVSYGFHILQVLERRSEGVRPLEEVREELAAQLRQQAVEESAVSDARDIVAAVRAGQSMDEAAQAAGWRVSELPLLERNRSLPMFGLDNSFLEAAYQLPVGPNSQPTGAISEPIPVPSGYVVIQLKEVSPEHIGEYDEVPLELLNRYRVEKAGEMMRDTARNLAEAAKQNGLRAAARRSGFTVEKSELVSRNGRIPGLGSVGEIAAAAFALEAGKTSDAMSLGGNWVVFRVIEQQQPDPAGLEGQKALLAEDLLIQKRRLAWDAFSAGVRKRLEEEGVIEINQAAVNSLLRRR